MNCPFDFLTQFDDWFLWQVDIELHGLTPAQATTNATFRKSGWKHVWGSKYGGWTLPVRKGHSVLLQQVKINY